MASNFTQPGIIVTLTAPTGGVVSGGVYQIGQLLVVAMADAAETLPFEGRTTGVFTVTKIGSQAWSEGDLVYWDDGNTRFTTVEAGHLLAGHAVAAVASGAGDTTGSVRLDGVARLNEAT
jgi:predicted RecA/RadA family phage recombinase